MSKSQRNVISPQEIIEKYGADIIRLWVAVTDYREDVRLSQDILNRVIDTYRNIRNTLRFLLGNLGDFVPARHAVPFGKMEGLDLAALGALNETVEKARRHFERFEFHLVTSTIADQFCIGSLSGFYLDVRKDALYCDPADSPRRRSAQTAFRHIARSLAKLLAPLLSFTAEETWQALRAQDLLDKDDDPESVFLNDAPGTLALPAAPALSDLLAVRRKINEAVEKSRQAGQLKGLNDAHAATPLPASLAAIPPDALAAWLGVAKVSPADAVSVEKAPGEKCPRCWVTRELPDGGLCARCAGAEKSLSPA